MVKELKMCQALRVPSSDSSRAAPGCTCTCTCFGVETGTRHHGAVGGLCYQALHTFILQLMERDGEQEDGPMLLRVRG